MEFRYWNSGLHREGCFGDSSRTSLFQDNESSVTVFVVYENKVYEDALFELKNIIIKIVSHQ